MKISITETINDGNLGDGWTNNFEAAKAFAEYCEEQYRDSIRLAAPEGVELDIEINISVNRDTCGVSSLDVACEDSQIVYAVEAMHGVAWERWAGNETLSGQYSAVE